MFLIHRIFSKRRSNEEWWIYITSSWFSIIIISFIFLGVGKIRKRFMKDSIGLVGHNILKDVKKALDP